MVGSDGSTVRQFGQRPLPPPFLLGTKSVVKEGLKSSKKLVPLSDFLDRKLGKNKATVTTRAVQEKQGRFLSAGPIGNPLGMRGGDVGRSSALDGAVFRQFKPIVKGEVGVGSSSGGEVGEEPQWGSTEDGHYSRKRKNPFANSAGEDVGPTASKLMLVLGDDPKPQRKQRLHKFRDSKEKPLFNHYGNGSGWWDGDREGFDSEEVGCNEVWEGMGSTTLGGLEWH